MHTELLKPYDAEGVDCAHYVVVQATGIAQGAFEQTLAYAQ